MSTLRCDLLIAQTHSTKECPQDSILSMHSGVAGRTNSVTLIDHCIDQLEPLIVNTASTRRDGVYQTPFRLTTDDGVTHVLYENDLIRHTGFGWSSLCSEVRVPTEGEQFELNTDISEASISCGSCMDIVDRRKLEINAGSFAGKNGCLFHCEWGNKGELLQAVRTCRHDSLHTLLTFEPETFSGDLKEQVEEVCSDCWSKFFDQEWSHDNEGSEVHIELSEREDRSEYFASRIEAIRGGSEATLQIVSENGLKKRVRRDEIVSITLTPVRQVEC